MSTRVLWANGLPVNWLASRPEPSARSQFSMSLSASSSVGLLKN